MAGYSTAHKYLGCWNVGDFFLPNVLTLMQIIVLVVLLQYIDWGWKKRGKQKAGPYPWFLGSSHCVVLVGWWTKYTLPFVSVLFSGKKHNRWCCISYLTCHYIGTFITIPKKNYHFFSPTQYAVNDLQYLPQPCGRGPSGSNSLLAVAANWSCSWERFAHVSII